MNISRFLTWHKILKNWPLRVYERFGLVRGDLVYRMRQGLRLHLRGGAQHSDALILWDVYVNEPYTQDKCRIEPGDIVVDIGAHVGFFSTWAASVKRASKVYSFEAHPVNFSYLIRNISENHLSNITAINQAVAGVSQRVKLYLHEEGTGGNSLYREHVKQSQDRFVEVEACTLKDILNRYKLEKVDLLKLDCEGAEYEILQKSSPETLQRIRRIAMEFHTIKNYSLSSLQRHLESSGFQTQKKGNAILYAWRKE